MTICFFLFCRVKLQRLSSSTLGFLSKPTQVDSPDPIQANTNERGQTILEEEELVINWNEKYFSQVVTRYYYKFY